MEDKKIYLKEFDKYGRYIESPCYGCELDDCRFCPRESKEEMIRHVRTVRTGIGSVGIVLSDHASRCQRGTLRTALILKSRNSLIMKTLWSLSDRIFFAKISVSLEKEKFNTDKVVYYRKDLSFNDVFRWFDYFDYLQARIKVKNPKRRVILELGRCDDDMLMGKEFITHRRAVLLKSYKKKLDKLLTLPVVADLFGFADEDRQRKVTEIQSYIQRLEGGEICFPVISDYINNLKDWI